MRGAIGVFSIVLAGCASVAGNSAGELVKQRATDRWSALVRGEFSKAYTYSTLGFRTVVTLDGFRSRFGNAVQWVGSEVTEVVCPEATKCDAKVRIDFKPVVSGKAGGEISTYVDETWLLEDGQWWYFQPLKSN